MRPEKRVIARPEIPVRWRVREKHIRLLVDVVKRVSGDGTRARGATDPNRRGDIFRERAGTIRSVELV